MLPPTSERQSRLPPSTYKPKSTFTRPYRCNTPVQLPSSPIQLQQQLLHTRTKFIDQLTVISSALRAHCRSRHCVHTTSPPKRHVPRAAAKRKRTGRGGRGESEDDSDSSWCASEDNKVVAARRQLARRQPLQPSTDNLASLDDMHCIDDNCHQPQGQPNSSSSLTPSPSLTDLVLASNFPTELSSVSPAPTNAILDSKLRRSKLPGYAVHVLKQWFDVHHEHPYPTVEQKQELAVQARVSVKQVSNWLTNMRKRHWSAQGKRARKPNASSGDVSEKVSRDGEELRGGSGDSD